MVESHICYGVPYLQTTHGIPNNLLSQFYGENKFLLALLCCFYMLGSFFSKSTGKIARIVNTPYNVPTNM